MKWDNCYTFVLKLLDIFDKYKDIESDDFVGLFEKDYNLKQLKHGDIIICEYTDVESDDSYSYRNNEFCDGILVTNKVMEVFHFMLVYKDSYILDLSFNKKRENYIRIRSFSCLEDIDKTKWKLYKLILE